MTIIEDFTSYNGLGAFSITMENDSGGKNTYSSGSAQHRLAINIRNFKKGSPPLCDKEFHSDVEQQKVMAAAGKVERETYVRVGPCENGGIVIDQGGPHGKEVMITRDGLHTGKSDTLFLRSSGTLALPDPDLEGNLATFCEFAPKLSEDQILLLLIFLLSAMQPYWPCPVLLITGPKGSAKSTLTRMIRALIDPSVSQSISLPGSERDMIIAAKNSWLLMFDNQRKLAPKVSDWLCRLATGAGFRTRMLYTDADEMLFYARRPIVLNGITQLAGEPDLNERSIIIDLPKIAPEDRRTEQELDEAFNTALPAIFGGLCVAIQKTLELLPKVEATSLHRMADFSRFASAAEVALGYPPGSFDRAYTANQHAALAAITEADPVAYALTRFMAGTSSPWVGSSARLLESLKPFLPRMGKDSVDSPRSLSVRLRGLVEGLECLGIGVELGLNVNDQKRQVRVQLLSDEASVSVGDQKSDSDLLSASPGMRSSLVEGRRDDHGDGLPLSVAGATDRPFKGMLLSSGWSE